MRWQKISHKYQRLNCLDEFRIFSILFERLFVLYVQINPAFFLPALFT